MSISAAPVRWSKRGEEQQRLFHGRPLVMDSGNSVHHSGRTQELKSRVLSKKWGIPLGVGISMVIIIGALFLSGALPGALHSAQASGGGGGCPVIGNKTVCTFKGLQANASFSSNNGCISTEVDLSALQDVSQSPTDPSAGTTFVTADFLQFDTCQGIQVADAFGEVSGVTFQGDQALTAASLTATIPLNNVDGSPAPTLTVAVTWQGFGANTTEIDTTFIHSPGFTYRARSQSVTRSASATGSISDGVNEYVTGPTLSADVSMAQNGSITVQHA